MKWVWKNEQVFKTWARRVETLCWEHQVQRSRDFSLQPPWIQVSDSMDSVPRLHGSRLLQSLNSTDSGFSLRGSRIQTPWIKASDSVDLDFRFHGSRLQTPRIQTSAFRLQYLFHLRDEICDVSKGQALLEDLERCSFLTHVPTYGCVLMDSSDMNWRAVSVVPGRSGGSPGCLG